MVCPIESWRTNITAANFADNGPVHQSGQRIVTSPARGASVQRLGATGGHLLRRAHTHIKFVLLCSPGGTKWVQEKRGPLVVFAINGAKNRATGPIWWLRWWCDVVAPKRT